MMRADLRQTQKFGNVCTNSHLQQLLQSFKSKFSRAFFFSAASFTLSLFLQTAGKCWVTLWCVSRRTTPVVHPGIRTSSSLCYTRSKYEGESWPFFLAQLTSYTSLHMSSNRCSCFWHRPEMAFTQLPTQKWFIRPLFTYFHSVVEITPTRN